MRKFSILMIFMVAFLSCHHGDLITKAVTVRFTNVLADHMTLTLTGDQHQGTYVFNSDIDSVQTKNLPDHGRYTITWSVNPNPVSSCELNLDAGGVILTLPETGPGSTSHSGLKLSHNYTFGATCR